MFFWYKTPFVIHYLLLYQQIAIFFIKVKFIVLKKWMLTCVFVHQFRKRWYRRLSIALNVNEKLVSLKLGNFQINIRLAHISLPLATINLSTLMLNRSYRGGGIKSKQDVNMQVFFIFSLSFSLSGSGLAVNYWDSFLNYILKVKCKLVYKASNFLSSVFLEAGDGVI